MTLEPFFSLTPKQPSFSTTENSTISVPQIKAFVNFWNIAALAWGGAGNTKPTLESQLNDDWVYMSGGSAAPYNEDVDSVIQNRERSQIIEIGIQGINVNERNKILLMIDLHALGENSVVHLAVSRKIIKTEHLRLGDNSLSVLIDIPYDQAWMYLDIKHIQTAEGKASAFGFKKVTGYLL
ncbi:MAG TPA: hypothetical protein DEP19_01640 [Anaerolineae bacterium]|nr:hypothetical protein [Anaerolineae bacterium]HCK65461.1 hypothetical protein [Anaerolineae bacterium]